MRGLDLQQRFRFVALSVSLLTMLSACASSGGGKPAAINGPVALSATAAEQAAAQPVMIPVEAQQQFDRALAALKAGQNEAAKQQFQQLAEAYPGFAGPLINLGLLELKAARYDAAVELFKRAAERDAKSAAAGNYLGVSYRYLGRFKDAEAAYLSAIAADATYAAAHLNLGVLYDLYLQQPERALPEYERYQELLDTPDAKVASWIKELNTRLNADKKARTASGAQP